MTGSRMKIPAIAVAAVPIVWLLIFLVVPLLIVVKISFSEAIIAQPPYTPMISAGEDQIALLFKFESYRYLVEDSLYLKAFVSSVTIAFFSTLLTLIFGYPLAYYIARASRLRQNIMLVLVILPFWTSFLLRIYAWVGFLGSRGPLNSLLMAAGIIDEPLRILHTDLAVYIGIVYTYLPFMVLPLYASLSRIETPLLEASADLGAGALTTFWKVIGPLSLPGVVAGSMLVFIPVVGEFVIPELLGGPQTLMIGKVVWGEFFANRDWPLAAAVTTVMILVLVLPIMLMPQRLLSRQDELNQ